MNNQPIVHRRAAHRLWTQATLGRHTHRYVIYSSVISSNRNITAMCVDGGGSQAALHQ